MQKRVMFLAIVLIVLVVGCQSPRVSVGVPCDEAGRLQLTRVEETARGYPYIYQVYLPPCYDLEPERRYPILYLFPGRISGPTAWLTGGVADVADEMILSGHLPPLIIVGLENTDSDLQAADFINDAFPYIESHYRILDGPQYHATGGGSLGGGPAYRMAFRFPERFGSAALFGSGAISGEEPQIRAWLDAIPSDTKPRVFLNTGFQDPLMLKRAEVMIEILDEEGVESKAIFTDGVHDYSYWVSNFPEYLRWLAEGW
jgi:enterochelin esterase-like enzyme